MTGAGAWPLAMVVMMGVGGGLMISLIRLATTGGVPFIPFAFWNAAFGAAVLLAIAVARRTPPRWKPGHLRIYVILGALGIAGPMCVFAFVSPKLPASVVAVTQTLIPIMTYALALAVGVERLRWLRVSGIALGFAGVLLIVVPGNSLPEPGMAVWVLVLLLTAFSLALVFVATAKFRPLEAASLRGRGQPVRGHGVPAAGHGHRRQLVAVRFRPRPGRAVDAGMAALYALLLVFFYEVIRLAGPVFVSVNNYLVPLAGVAWGMAIFGDSLSGWVWGALALMIAGVVLMTARGARPASTEAA